MREKGACVISGFHSPLEKDVFDILIKGKQPLIIALAKSLPKKLSETLEEVINQKRLVVISPFGDNIKRSSAKTAQIRNQLMIELAEEITIGYCSSTGKLHDQIKQVEKQIRYLTI